MLEADCLTSYQNNALNFSPMEKVNVNYQSRTEEKVNPKASKKLQSKIYIWGSFTQQDYSHDHSQISQQSEMVHSFRMVSKDEERNLTKERQERAQKIAKLKNTAIVNVQCGRNHSAFVTKKGELYMVGSNDQGQLGLGNTEAGNKFFIETPFQISSLMQKGLLVEQVACGFAHTVIITKNGQIFSWGYGKFGALGLGHLENRSHPTELSYFSSLFDSSKDVVSLQCGAHHTGLLDTQGILYMWGAGEVGQLGTQNKKNESIPQIIQLCMQESENVQQIALGYFHTVILSSKGRIFQTGVSSKQSKIENKSLNYTEFAEVQSLRNIGTVNIKAKEVSTIINEKGEIFYWANPNSIEQVKSIKADDFELCKDFILIRSRNKFFKYFFENKLTDIFKEFKESIKIRDLTILACGHQYIIGVRSYCKNQSKSRNLRQNQKNTIQESQSVKDLGYQVTNFDNNNQQLIDKQSEQIQQSFHDGNSTQVRRVSTERMTRLGSQAEAQYSVYSINLESVQRQRKLDNEISSYRNGFSKKQSLQNEVIKENQQNSIQRPIRKSLTHRNSNPYQQEIAQDGSENQSRIMFQDQSNYAADSPLKSVQVYEQNQQNDTLNTFNNVKSMRISYDEDQLKQKNIIQSDLYDDNKILNAHSRRQFPLSREMSESEYIRLKQNSIYDKSKDVSEEFMSAHSKSLVQSEKKSNQRDGLKDALQKEIRIRLKLEQDFSELQRQFESFKNDVGVDQMKIVLAESQEEYHKLYEICVQECEKAAKFNEMYKKEKKSREERENQIIDQGEENTMLKNQIRYLEDELNMMREQREQDSSSLQTTVLEQQRIIESLKSEFLNEKNILKEKIFDLEEQIAIANENSQKQEEQYTHELQVEKEKGANALSHLKEMKEVIEKLNVENQDLLQRLQVSEKQEKDVEGYKQQILGLQQTIQIKNLSLSQCDMLISDLRSKEQELINAVEKLQKQLNSQQPVVNISNMASQSINRHPLAQSQQNLPTSRSVSASRSQSKSNKPTTSNTQKNENLQNPKIISQTQLKDKTATSSQSNFNSSAYSSRKPSQQYNSKQQTLKSIERERSNNKETLNTSKESHSPEKLKQIIDKSEESSKSFINDVQKIVGFSRGSNKQDLSHQATVPQQQTQKSRQSQQQPIDYLGLRPKSQNQYTPRLNGSQSYRLQSNQVQNSSSNGNNLKKSRNNPVLNKDLSQQDILTNKTVDELNTPSQCSLNVTPQILSSRLQIPQQQQQPIESSQKSMFDHEFEQQTDTEQANQGSMEKQSQSKKHVKFVIDSKNYPGKDQNEEDEINKLYESLNNEMKSLKQGSGGSNTNGNTTSSDNLKEKLEAIRKNKALLEAKIKDYEKKLGK